MMYSLGSGAVAEPQHCYPDTNMLPSTGLRRELSARVAQIESFKAFAAKALTTFVAGFAATFTSFPNIIFFPAFRAGLCFSLSIQTCGMTNFSVFFTSAVAMAVNAASTLFTSFGLSPADSPIFFVRSPAVIARAPPFIAFIATMVVEARVEGGKIWPKEGGVVPAVAAA